MLTGRFLLGRARDALTAEDQRLLEEAIGSIRTIPARHQMVRRGEMPGQCMLLIEGFMCRYLDDREGYRQVVALHVPGDFVDLHGLPMQRMDHDIATLSLCRVAFYDHAVLADLLGARPHLTRILWFATLLDASIHREWIFRMGRLGAEGRVAHFFCELNARLEMVELASHGHFSFPATQGDVAEACGITGVHVNRVLRLMRERELLLFRGGEVQILDLPRLQALGEFHPDYLYGSMGPWLRASGTPAPTTGSAASTPAGDLVIGA